MIADFLKHMNTSVTITSASSPHTAALYTTYIANCTGGVIASSIPAIPIANAKIIYFKSDSSANALTITVTGGALIEGRSSIVLSAIGQMVSLVGDGTLWHRENVYLPICSTKAFADSPYSAIVDGVILYNAVGGNSSVVLPAAASFPNRVVTVKKTDSSAYIVTITVVAGGSIDDTTFYVLALQNQAVSFISNGTQWWVI